MNLNLFLPLLLSLFFGITTFGTVEAQIFSINDIEFIQSGKLFTEEREFDMSNQIMIKEFFDVKIIKITGYTVDGYPYVTYSKMHNDQITTRGKIFIDDIGTPLFFDQQQTLQFKKNAIVEKSNELLILVQYTERLYSGQTAKIDVKIFDINQNKLNYFNQNYGYVPDTNI